MLFNLYKDILEKKARMAHELPELSPIIFAWLRTELTYTSGYLEGNTLTRRETALTVKEGITSGSKPLREYLEAKNLSEAFDSVLHFVKEPESSYEGVILSLHASILKGIADDQAGRYRNVRVRIAGSSKIFPNPLSVQDLMARLCSRLERTQACGILKALEAHYQLVAIHPFADGNGRTARLFMNFLLLRAGVLPLIVPPRERKRYLAHLSRRDDGEILAYYAYMLKLLQKSLEMYLKMFFSRCEKGSEKAEEVARPLMRISEFARFCGVPVTTLRYYLRAGALHPTTYTNAGDQLFSEDLADVVHGKQRLKSLIARKP